MKKINDSVLLSRLILKMYEQGLYTQGLVSFHYVFDAWIYGVYVVSSVEINSLMDAKKEGLF
jgi:hypothetical protein